MKIARRLAVNSKHSRDILGEHTMSDDVRSSAGYA